MTAAFADEGVAIESTHFDGFGEFVEFKRRLPFVVEAKILSSTSL
jgi:hypothetical protein